MEGNLSRAIELVERAARAGAQLVVLPELFCTPYFCRERDAVSIAAARRDYSVSIPGQTTEALSRAARDNRVVLVGGSVFEKAGDEYFNTSPVFNSDGEMLGTYRKAHIPDDEGFRERDYFSPGDTGFNVFETSVGKVAVQICYDQWFPEWARLAALQGAEVLVYPTAIGDVDLIKEASEGNWQQMWTAAQVGHAGSIRAVRVAAPAMPTPSSDSSVAGRIRREASQPQPMRPGTATATAIENTRPMTMARRRAGT